MSRLLIGVTPTCNATEPINLHISEGIVEAVKKLGGEPYMIDYTKLKLYELIGLVSALDGVIFSGGRDIHPSNYGETDPNGLCNLHVERDEIELNMFPLLLTRKLPIFGICRGLQVINVALGGTLEMDIPTTYGVSHRQEDYRTGPSHDVSIVKDTLLHRVLNEDGIRVNSLHHQCIKKLADGLVPNAYAPEGFLEGFESADESQFIFGVQWHPELTINDDVHSLKLFAAFMDAVKARKGFGC